MTVHTFSDLVVEKLQIIIVQAGHRGVGCRFLATKTERQFHLYPDLNTFNLFNPYSEMLYLFKLWTATAFWERFICPWSIIVHCILHTKLTELQLLI